MYKTLAATYLMSEAVHAWQFLRDSADAAQVSRTSLGSVWPSHLCHPWSTRCSAESLVCLHSSISSVSHTRTAGAGMPAGSSERLSGIVSETRRRSARPTSGQTGRHRARDHAAWPAPTIMQRSYMHAFIKLEWDEKKQTQPEQTESKINIYEYKKNLRTEGAYRLV